MLIFCEEIKREHFEEFSKSRSRIYYIHRIAHSNTKEEFSQRTKSREILMREFVVNGYNVGEITFEKRVRRSENVYHGLSAIENS